MGHGLGSKGPDGPVSSIDTLLTAKEFDTWVAENGWSAPKHIRWYFQSELVAPRVSDAARPKIRVWPASQVRTAQTNVAVLEEILRRYPKVLVPEMNMGQLWRLLRAEYLVDAKGFNQVPLALRRPEQRRFWIATGGRFDQVLERCQQVRVFFCQFLATPASLSASMGG